MRPDIYLILAFDIKTDRHDSLFALVNTVTEGSRREKGCLAYEFSVDKDRSKAHMIEHFESSETFVAHIVDGFTPHADEWNSYLALRSLIVIGEPSDELRRLLPPDAIYTDRIAP